MSDLVALHVEIPEGCHPGSKFNVQAPDGRNFQLVVPQGTRPGDLIEVHLAPETTFTTPSAPPMSASAPAGGAAQAPTSHSAGAKAAMAAGVAAVVVGTLVVGPVTGIACAGAAVYATTRDDAIGDAARALGSASIAAYGKAKEIDAKYGIWDKVKDAASKTASKAAEINAEYHLTDKASAAAASGVAKVREFDGGCLCVQTAAQHQQ